MPPYMHCTVKLLGNEAKPVDTEAQVSRYARMCMGLGVTIRIFSKRLLEKVFNRYAGVD